MIYSCYIMLDQFCHGHLSNEMSKALASLHSTAIYSHKQKWSYQSWWYGGIWDYAHVPFQLNHKLCQSSKAATKKSMVQSIYFERNTWFFIYSELWAVQCCIRISVIWTQTWCDFAFMSRLVLWNVKFSLIRNITMRDVWLL